MKKLISVIYFAFFVSTLFATGLSIQLNAGYGYINGKRYFTKPDNSVDYKVSLKATGIEAGTIVNYQFNNQWGISAYFDYLFALKGSFDPDNAPKLDNIAKDMKYTDYKAGLGAQYRVLLEEKDYIRLIGGINFAGVSNHTYPEGEKKIIENQIAGNKVTSFGLFLSAGEVHKINNKIDISASIHSCFNPIGIIRYLDTNQHKWINVFKGGKTYTRCFTTFAQLGLIYNF